MCGGAHVCDTVCVDVHIHNHIALRISPARQVFVYSVLVCGGGGAHECHIVCVDVCILHLK